jgi:hypothetical protein
MGAGAMPSATAVARARASAADVGASERRSASGAGSRISAGVWRPAEHGQYVQDEAQGGISEASENTVAPGGGGERGWDEPRRRRAFCLAESESSS